MQAVTLMTGITKIRYGLCVHGQYDWGVEVVVVGGEGGGGVIAPTERGRGLHYLIFSILSTTKFI